MANIDYDVFADVINGNNGIFAEEAAALEPGLSKYDSAHTVAAPDGVHINMFCRGCGYPKDVTLGYHEMVAIKYRCPPQAAYQGTNAAVNTQYGWSAPNGAFYPKVGCTSCGTPCAPLITPEEAEKHLATARANAWISPQDETQLAHMAASKSAPYRAQIVQAPGMQPRR
jgi:predicted component of type VI protein secretion system